MFVSEFKTPEQLEAMALTLYIDDITRRIDTGELEDPDDPNVLERPPSPPPEYDRSGKRINTRVQRLLKFLEVERSMAVQKALELIPNYAPPPTLTKLTRCTQKLYLPVRAYPHINFIGLLLGPRGNNLRNMEQESGAKISIRGRGSVKEGGRAAPSHTNEELHCVVSAISQRSIAVAKSLIHNVINTAIETPEHENGFKRLQLRELAKLNGTLRDFDSEQCGFCRIPGHRKYECPDRQAVVSKSQCRKCGTLGHFEKNCVNKKEAQLAASRFLEEIQDFDASNEPNEQELTVESENNTPAEEILNSTEKEFTPVQKLVTPSEVPKRAPPLFKLGSPKPFLRPPTKWQPSK